MKGPARGRGHVLIPALLTGILALSGCPVVQQLGIVAPDAPAGLVVTNPTASTLDVSWNPVSGAVSYTLSRSLSQNGTYVQVATITATSCTVTGLSSGTTYYFEAISTNSGGSSPPSAAVSGATTGPSGGGGNTVATPTFSPAGGSYVSAQSVTITTSTAGAAIRYTTDGSTPTSSTGTVYTSAVSVSSTTTINAIAYKSGMADSSVATATYTIGPITLLSDGFETGTNWAGSGWTATSGGTGTAAAWTQVASGSHPATSPRSGSFLARFNSFDSSIGNSATLNRSTGFAVSSSFSTLTLTFWINHSTVFSDLDSVQVEVSTDGGATWPTVGSPVYRYDGTTGWAEVTVDLSSYIGAASLQVGFLGYCAGGYDIYIDDVAVIGQ